MRGLLFNTEEGGRGGYFKWELYLDKSLESLYIQFAMYLPFRRIDKYQGRRGRWETEGRKKEGKGEGKGAKRKERGEIEERRQDKEFVEKR